MMRLSFTLLLTLLSGCATGLPKDAGAPPPDNYRAIVAGDFLQRFQNQYSPIDAVISEPQVGGRDMVTAWRVCVGARPVNGDDAVAIGYFFVDRRIKSATVDDIKCEGFEYETWPELENTEGWSSN